MSSLSSIPEAISAVTTSLAALPTKAAQALPPRLQSMLSALPSTWMSYLVPGLLGYLLLVRTLRHRREHAQLARYPYSTREALPSMTVEDAHAILRDLSRLEFPLMIETSLQFGLFKTYGVESISRLLLATRNLTDPVMSKRRYEDTGVLLGEFMSHPPGSQRAVAAVARMNFLHARYVADGTISNADLLYTLSVFVLEPERFVRLYEWRPLNDMEFCAYGVFWKSIGDAMGIRYEGSLSQDSWASGLDWALDLRRWAKAYEVVAFKPSAVSNRPAVALIPMITYWTPAPLRPFAHECVHALLGDRVREAFMLPEPSVAASSAVFLALRLRQLAVRHLCLPRLVPYERHGGQPDDKGYINLGFSYGNYPFYIKPTVWNRWGPVAWLVWLAGGKLPGDDPDEFRPQGFSALDLGPVSRMGTGKEEMRVEMERLRAKGMWGCPF